MLSIFRSKNPLNILLLAGYALLFFGSLYFSVQGEVELIRDGTSPLWDIIFPAVLPGWLNITLAALLLLVQALLFNQILAKFKVIYPINYLAALFYILAGISMGAVLSPALLGLTFLIVALSYLLLSYEEDKADSKLLDAGLFLGLASLFHVSYLFFLPFALLAVLYLRSPDFRELMVVISGFLAVYIITFTVVFMWGDLFYFAVDHFRLADSFGLKLTLPELYSRGAALILPLLLLVAGVVFMQARMLKSLIQVRKIYFLMLIFLAFSVVSTALVEDPRLSGMIVFAVPVAFFAAYLVQYSGWKRSWELVHLIWVGLLVGLMWVKF